MNLNLINLDLIRSEIIDNINYHKVMLCFPDQTQMYAYSADHIIEMPFEITVPTLAYLISNASNDKNVNEGEIYTSVYENLSSKGIIEQVVGNSYFAYDEILLPTNNVLEVPKKLELLTKDLTEIAKEYNSKPKFVFSTQFRYNQN